MDNVGPKSDLPQGTLDLLVLKTLSQMGSMHGYGIVLHVQSAFAAKDKDPVAVRAYVNESCIIADEPFFLPAPPPKDGTDQATAKFLPLLGLVIWYHRG